MSKMPVVMALRGVSFGSAVTELSTEKGFVAFDRIGDAGRYSVVSANPIRTFAFSGAFVSVDGHTVIDSPHDALKRFLADAGKMTADPYLPFSGGAFGYIGFEGTRAIKGFEPAKGFSRYPQCSFGIYETAVVFDNVEGTAFVVSNGERAAAKAEGLVERIEGGRMSFPRVSSGNPVRNSTDWIPDYCLGDDNLGLRDDNLGLRDDNRDDCKKYERTVKEAELWLKSECLDRVHIARRSISMCRGTTEEQVAAFLASGLDDVPRAIFSNDGVYATVESDGIVLDVWDGTIRNGVFNRLMDRLPLTETSGYPVDKAVSFITGNEEDHRMLYGGVFGCVDANRARFYSIDKAFTFVDGTMGVTTGVDVTA